jgi:hypothetical protein
MSRSVPNILETHASDIMERNYTYGFGGKIGKAGRSNIVLVLKLALWNKKIRRDTAPEGGISRKN